MFAFEWLAERKIVDALVPEELRLAKS